MRLILALAAVPLIGAAPPAEKSSPSSRWATPIINPQLTDVRCPDTPMSQARQHGEGPQIRPLNELPDAQVLAAVDRRIDNCPAPMLLSEARR